MQATPDAMSRHALALWFAGLAALGLLRFWRAWHELAGQDAPISMWLWLAGSLACAVVALAVFLRTMHAPRD